MIIDEFKSDSTLIRFDDRDIETKENNEDILNMYMDIYTYDLYIHLIPINLYS